MKENYLQYFADPPAMFRGAPFWAWNCKLDKETVLKQIDYFKEMGIGGFTMHSRTGLDNEYLGDEFIEIVKACVGKAKELGMKAYLYDEDRWPSGAAGGEVTKDEKFRGMYVAFAPQGQDDLKLRSGRVTGGSSPGILLARYEIHLENGLLVDYKRLAEGETGDNIWIAQLHTVDTSPWFNNMAYVNTLDKAAIEKFIEVTHEAYFKAVGDEFGAVVPSIFTDEPQFVQMTNFGRADDKKPVVIPFDSDFESSYLEAYGQSLLDHLPELFWELPDKTSVVRYRYHEHLAERFTRAFSDTIGKWCAERGLKLTGHLMAEESLNSQSVFVGEVMRHFRSFQIPGIDMLCDRREYTTAKQAQSAAHQTGANEVLSELYGVTNWDFDFRGHKLQGDWQAALGVTLRVHHLSWMSMAGEAKRDYPASIFYQSPWYKKYTAIETYFARVNTALRTGKPVARIGVIHPIESFWLLMGPDEQTADTREKMEQQFAQVTEWLIFGLMDFDYISESLLTTLNDLDSAVSGRSLCVGEMKYGAIIVPGCITLRESTIRRLDAFAEAGGDIIFMGGVPELVDAKPDDLPENILSKASVIGFDPIQLLNALDRHRIIDIRTKRGVRGSNYLTQLRAEGDDLILFIANGREVSNQDIPVDEDCEVIINGVYDVTVLDAMTGESFDYHAKHKNDTTVVNYRFYQHDSLLLYLQKAVVPKAIEEVSPAKHELVSPLNGIGSFSMSEQNVLLLDMAEYALDSEGFRGKDEILKIDNILRKELGYPLKQDAYAQPWTVRDKENAKHNLRLRFHISSEICVSGAELALEGAECCEIIFNGDPVDLKTDGWFTDECIRKLKLPDIRQSLNELVISRPYSAKTNLEWCYLLGDFGVRLYGDNALIVTKPEKIGFSDLAGQGFPFYAGNITYIRDVEFPEGDYELEVTKFRAPVISVAIDGKDAGLIMFSPYRVPLGHLSGKHRIEITAYGNRVNAFGAVHNCDERLTWFGPNAWRSDGAEFSYEYQLRRIGILAAPKLYRVL